MGGWREGGWDEWKDGERDGLMEGGRKEGRDCWMDGGIKGWKEGGGERMEELISFPDLKARNVYFTSPLKKVTKLTIC